MYLLKSFRILFLVLFISSPGISCTIFTASDGKTVLVGNNEDSSPTLKTYLWFRPASKQKYGFVIWGAQKQFPEGGMNEKGLFWDAAALMQAIPIQLDASKPDFKGYFVDKALAECATVEEVVQLVKRYNLVWQDRAQVLVADASGDYALIHANYVIRKSDKQKPYMAVANFPLYNFDPAHATCYRYNTAQTLLGENSVSVPLFKKILSKAAQQSVDNATIYSQIADLKNGQFYLYQHHNFEKEVKINLADELREGVHRIEIKNLFPVSIRQKLEPVVLKKGADPAIELYRHLKSTATTQYNFDENELDELGYALLNGQKVTDAIQLFTFNQNEYPKSDKALTSLAIAYLVKGDVIRAKDFFDQALRINPKNEVALLFSHKTDGKVTFRIKDLEYAGKISLVGSFNNWDTKANIFTKDDQGQWKCEVALKPGIYSYVLLVGDDNWMTDPANKLAHKPEQYWRSMLIVQ